jgi:Flp pilus assembly protein TadG
MGATRSGPRDGDQRGAALIEFAILTPLLVLLVFGIIEFGWLFGQFNDIRHASREGARFAAVNGGSETEIAQRVCQAVEGFDAGITSLTVELTDGTTQVEGETYFGAIGDLAEIVVRAEVSSLSGLPIITTFLPSELSSDVSFRLERNSEAWDTTLVPIDAGVLC